MSEPTAVDVLIKIEILAAAAQMLTTNDEEIQTCLELLSLIEGVAKKAREMVYA